MITWNSEDTASPCCPVGAGAFAFDFDIEQTVDLVKVGVNYKFGYGPVVARY
jgi:hypothetical protein